MKKVLLIFDWFGEADTGVYLIDYAPDWLFRCNGQYINETEDENIADLIARVMDAITGSVTLQSNPDDVYAGAWVTKRIDHESVDPIDMGTVHVIITGCVP